jgi:hypothetical protein
MNMHAENPDISGAQRQFSSRFLSDSLNTGLSEQGITSLERESLQAKYLPPEGIDMKPFEGMSRSDFFVKVPEKTQTDPHLLIACARAVQDTSEYLHEFSSKGVIENIMTEKEVVDHLEIFSNEAAEAALILNNEVGNIALVASPVGGIPPLHGVMERVSENSELARQLKFAPLNKNKPNTQALEIIRNASGFVHIDDGATLMTDQALLLEHLEEDPRWVQHAVREIKRIHVTTGTSMDDEQVPFYNQLISGFAKHNMVVAPLYTKNPRFFEMLGEAASRQNDAWGAAQQGILERSIRVIPESKTAVGSMVSGIPCRDKGITLTELSKEKIIDPKVERILQRAGLGEVDFRLFSNLESLESINHAYDQFLHGFFADQLRGRVLNYQ